MSNNINNLNGFNAINFNGKNKSEKEEAPKCDCPDCIQTEASAMEALGNVGKAMALKGAYKFDPKNVEKDIKEFQNEYYDAVVRRDLRDVADEYEQSLIASGIEPTSAYEKAEIFRACLEHNKNV